tara:strand:+ start:26 stop:1870 length:1845 start_codon:yes stop_codon:yes gene_type:complete
MAFTKIAAAGIGSTETVTLHSLEVLNNATVGGVLTYEDVTNVDSVGLITARAGIVVGSGITLSKDGDIFATGVTTATSFVGDGSQLTGVASTENIRTNTNATFLQNINVSGTSTIGGDVNIADKIVHIGDTNTAIRFPAADTVTVETGGSERIRIDSDGRSLVGTTSNSNAVRAVFQGYTGGGDNLQARVQFQTNQATNLASNNHLANLLFTNASGSVGAQIDVKADAAWGTDDYPARIEFKTTADGASSPTERLRITSTGYVGVGINDPARILHLHEASSDTVQLHITNSTTGTSGSDGVSFALGSDESLIINQRESNHISLKTADTERLRISSSGKVRVGSGDATYPFEVYGADQQTILIGSTNAGGVYLTLDGDSNGDGSGGDYASIGHTTAGNLEISADNPNGDANILFFAGNATERLRIASSGQIGLSGANYGSSGQVLTSQGSSSAATWTTLAGGLFASYAVICETKNSGTLGGSFTSGSWQQRNLNTELTDPDGIVSVSSNAFTLQAGSYLIKIMAPAYGVGRHQVRLRNDTDSSVEFYGKAAFEHQSSYTNGEAFGIGRVTIASAKSFIVQHRCAQTINTIGYGVDAGFESGVDEIYTLVEIYKES